LAARVPRSNNASHARDSAGAPIWPNASKYRTIPRNGLKVIF